ncbi:nuclear transcription factor Y subunit A-10-like [Andrographis paniculata]|uniref:nuclear transcription factor Y subunit A-10-like n=1 Tax=Andrographis paniculata TaxID=175694 RepID=UPI0021E9059C|nr:nuclear transcription factor Y subunit A-10-like [Andrographis paniculata]
MTMHTVFFKEHQENVAQDSGADGCLSSVTPWSELRSQPQPAVAYTETFGQSKMASLELFAGAKQPEEHQFGLAAKGNTTPFTLFSGDYKAADQKAQIQTITMDGGHFDIGFGQPLIYGKYPYAEPFYGVNSIYGAQVAGRIMLPMSMSADGGPIFVNAKQHNGIMRRRRKRAEAELENKVLRYRKPYLHLSRHLHAMRRPRGNGGRFLNTKNTSGGSEKPALKSNTTTATITSATTTGECRKQSGSQVSEVLQNDGGGINSKGTNSYSSRSMSPNSEVTSHHHMFFLRGGSGGGGGGGGGGSGAQHHHQFQINRLHPSFQPFPDVADTDLGIAMAASGDY